ncbi:hypothetical protein KSC_100170 [Ktedonobacter sp. SOSP1-52]|nr:hypothetical protein KSC_100170 [Ktedonobacter sp. SOSP1-52]
MITFKAFGDKILNKDAKACDAKEGQTLACDTEERNLLERPSEQSLIRKARESHNTNGEKQASRRKQAEA